MFDILTYKENKAGNSAEKRRMYTQEKRTDLVTICFEYYWSFQAVFGLNFGHFQCSNAE